MVNVLNAGAFVTLITKGAAPSTKVVAEQALLDAREKIPGVAQDSQVESKTRVSILTGVT